MKKRLSVSLVALLVLALAMPALAETPAVLDENLRVGTYEMGYDLDAMTETYTGSPKEGVVRSETLGEMIAVQSLGEAQMLLESGRLDAFLGIWETVAYVAAHNDKVTAMRGPAPVQLKMVVPNESEALAQRINEALAALAADGTVDALYAAHVQAVLDGAEPVAVEMPVVDGAETIIFGVSGDSPPIDFTTADGQPAGFNTALLAALAEQIGVNIELLTIESGARFTALMAGRIDAFFWHISTDIALEEGYVNETEEMKAVTDISDRFTLSDTYWMTTAGWLLPVK